jgi:hypothetical protein
MEIVIMVHVFPSSLVADDRRTTTAHEQPNAQSATRLSSRTEGNEAVYFMRGSNAAQNAAKLSWLIRTAELGQCISTIASACLRSRANMFGALEQSAGASSVDDRTSQRNRRDQMNSNPQSQA